ncbi:MAG TPA: Rieske 2Fe-2S domain-containing protein [Chloroflexota bacterium]|jgi:phenylpropionate dioxygenase-like ring-hydroxylating dioxygenase large terminal subunit
MLSKELNDLITLTNAGTPMGDLMRRYWLPALLSEELPAPDGPPVPVRLLGEELVAFRDSEGRVGLLDEHCAHRGTSLLYGRNEECGLRCIYHGWKYDVNGHVTDTPAEPGDSTFKARLRTTAYPAHEAGGLVWAYLGPPEKQPLFPNYGYTQLAPEHVYVTKCLQECNYLQGLEGECDSSHLSLLHRDFLLSGQQALYQADSAPIYETEDTDFGVRLIALRNAPPDQTYVRISSFVLPSHCWIYARVPEVHFYVPADDTHSWRYDLGMILDRPVRPEDVERRPQIGPDYRRVRNLANHYLQDRDKQKHQTFTGIENFLNHDSCATETQGARYDRSREHLGQSDRGVIVVRRALIDVVQRFQAGEEPPHLVYDPAQNHFEHVDTIQQLIPRGDDWHAHFPRLVCDARQPSTA